MTEKANTILTVTVSTAIIAGLVVFFGMQEPNVMPTDLKAEINQGIENYVAEKTEEAQGGADTAQDEEFEYIDIDMNVLMDDDPVKGDENAPVTIVEFSDYECPFCARYINFTYSQIKENYVDTGKVKYVFRDYPLGFHQYAYPAALAANCVREQGGDAGYYDFHDLLFANSENLGFEVFVGFVEELGYNKTEFEQCYEEDKYKDEIYGDMDDANAIGLSGTPSFVINGYIIRGAYPYEKFEEIIEKVLNE